MPRTKWGDGLVAEVSRALRIPFRRWAREKGYQETMAVSALRRWADGTRIRAWRTHLVLRDLLADLGYQVDPREPLPDPSILKKIITFSSKKNKP